MTYRIKPGLKLLSAFIFLISSSTSMAGLSLDDSPTPDAFRSVLSGPGLQLENLRFFKGVKGQYGVFVGGNEATAAGGATLGIPDGIYLSTGSKDSVLGPNNNDKYTYNTRIQYSDPDLTAIAANAIYDPVIIEFDLIPEGDQVNFLLVFGSEEYPEYVCSKFNDVFGLFVSGPGISGTRNAALIPGSSDPIAVNNVNSGMRGVAADNTACNLSNSIYFVDNGNGTGAAGTQMDGFTHPLTASLDGLQAGQRYRVKLALADAGDQAYDSAAFFKWLTSTSSAEVDLELSASASTNKPAKDGFLDIRYTVKNTSSTATKLVEVGIDLPVGVSWVSDDSSGAFSPAEDVWRVGDLGANESKTLDLRVSVGDAASYEVVAEIQYAFNEDSDSTPYNQLSIPGEDDTAILRLNPIQNNPPVISNADSAAAFSISHSENNTTPVVDLNAQDVDGDTEGSGLVWLISGGNDGQKFTLDANGSLRFIAPPDYEDPLDANTDNQYEVEVKVCDRASECDVQMVTVWVTDTVDEPSTVDNRAPTILHNGSAATATLSYSENATTPVVDLDAQDLDGDTEGDGLVWGLSGGADERRFTLDSMGGLRFIVSPDYESPVDMGADNRYEVEVRACDSVGACDSQLIAIVVDDIRGEPGTSDNNPPTILHNNSDPTAVISYSENEMAAVVELDAQDADGDAEGSGLVWIISGGLDERRFTLDSMGGLRFIVSPDYENPINVDADNRYKVEIKVCDSENTCDTQLITVVVNDVTDEPDTSDNNPPTILHNNSDPTASVSYRENALSEVVELDAQDVDGDTEGAGLVWIISGGVDERYFALDSSGGLHFIASPDYENALDMGADNRYEVEIKVCDSVNACDTQLISVAVSDVTAEPDTSDNSPPVILNINSAPTVSLSYSENATHSVVELDAEDDDGDTEGAGLVWTISGGADEQRFALDSRGGLRFIAPPDYENPADNNTDNYYDIKVSVCDSRNACDSQLMTIEVTDLEEDFDNDGVPGGVEEVIGSDPNKADTDEDGIDDKTEIGPDYTNPRDTDNDGVLDVLDTDDDGDGILTKDEDYNENSPADDDTDGDGVPDYREPDDDGDGVLTRHENYNGGTVADDDTDKDDIPDYRDADDDGDGLLTKNEQADPNNDGNPADAVDTEGDGLVDYLDFNNATALDDDDDGDGLDNQTEINLGSDPNDPDSDNDSLPDGYEQGGDAHPRDSDNDGIPDFHDVDDDNDGILNIDENYNGGSLLDDDTDLDKKPDYLDNDDDNDSILTRLEDYNGNGALDDDSDGDGKPDYLDTDDDGDGIFTWLENYNSALPLDDDTDGDGTPDYLDPDDDGDGLLTINESSDPNQNGNPDDAVDYDQDGRHNYIDADDDGDGKLTIDEMADPNGDGDPSDAVDADLDELPEYLDSEFTPFVRLSLRAMLQGAYHWDTEQMHTKLKDSGYVPLEQPYSSLVSSFGYGSTGNASPFGYQGSDVMSDSVAQAVGNDAVVDWVLIEIRDSERPTHVLASAAAVIQADGDIVIPETGDNDLILSGAGAGEHYVSIRHRNHLGVMTATPVPLKSDEALLYDFSDPDLPVYGDVARSEALTRHALMWAGDLNNSVSIISEGPGSDLIVMLGSVLVAPANVEANANYPLKGYYASDLNMDGKTVYSGPNNDSNILIGNVLLHPNNTDYIANFVVHGTLP